MSFWKIGPIAKASAGSVKPAAINAPAPWTVPVMKRRRVTVSPSNAPGMPRSAVYLDLLGLRVGANDAPGPGARKDTVKPWRRARRAPPGGPRAGRSGEHQRLRLDVAIVGAVTDGARPGAPERLAARAIATADEQRAQRDDVGQLADGVEVAERDEALEPERVEAVAGEQREVAIVAGHDPPGPVVQQEPLVDRLDQELVFVRVRLRARPGGRDPRRGHAVARGRRPLDRAAQRLALRRDDLAEALERAHASTANASAAASIVRSTCSASCASEGNHASNCDGGG